MTSEVGFSAENFFQVLWSEAEAAPGLRRVVWLEARGGILGHKKNKYHSRPGQEQMECAWRRSVIEDLQLRKTLPRQKVAQALC